MEERKSRLTQYNKMTPTTFKTRMSFKFSRKQISRTTTTTTNSMSLISSLLVALILINQQTQIQCSKQQQHQMNPTILPTQQQLGAKSFHNGFQLHSSPPMMADNSLLANLNSNNNNNNNNNDDQQQTNNSSQLACPNGLLTFVLSTGFIYKPTGSHETLSMMPSTLQLTDCLDYCLNNQSCLAINFEMGLCVLLASSASQNGQNLYSSQFPVFTIYAEKKCLLSSEGAAVRQRQKRCQRAWTFEQVAGYEMKTKARRRLKLASREACMDACLIEREFECRSANWHRLSSECALSDQDRHSVSQSEAGDQQVKSTLAHFYGPSNASLILAAAAAAAKQNNYLMYGQPAQAAAYHQPDNYLFRAQPHENSRRRQRRQMAPASEHDWQQHQQQQQHYVDQLPANAVVDYLENNCIYEPNKLCEFRKIQNRILKTVDSIYQDVGTLEECKQKCLNAPYRCYSFDYGDTSERVCRTSHLDQASLLSVKEPYLEVVGAITYELAACFNVSIQCRAKEMVAFVSSSKSFRGKIYAKTRPTTCVNDVREALHFELAMGYYNDSCDVRATSNQQRGVFSSDIVIQHHDRIMTTQDVGLSVYCQYDLGNRSVTNNVDLAIERLPDGGPVESKQQQQQQNQQQPAGNQSVGSSQSSSSSSSSPLTITGLATTVVRSPNVTMRITNMNGQPVSSATVGDRLALLFEVKEKSSPFGIFVREIVAMDGKQLVASAGQPPISANNNNNNSTANNKNDTLKLASNGRNNYLNNHLLAPGAHHYASAGEQQQQMNEGALIESMFQATSAGGANSIQFIDSDGCPTDANLMGPLVKMDPSGHRLLAPFDAFKFPTSDMVFFRAVVTSCLAECKPAVCSTTDGSRGPPDVASPASYGQQQQQPPPDLYLTTSTTTSSSTARTTAASTIETTSEEPYLLTSRMTAPPPTTGGGGNWPNRSTTLAGPLETLLDSNQTFARSTVGDNNEEQSASPTMTTVDGSSSSTQGMTIVVPGFSNTPPQPDSTVAPTTTVSTTTTSTTTPTPTTTLAATTASQLLAELLHQVNITTNNHNGKAPPRPTTTTTTTAMGSLGDNNNNNDSADPMGQMTSLLELASMTSEQKQQILDSFEAKLRQKFKTPSSPQLLFNGTNAPELLDLTDLYTGLVSSLVSSSSSSTGNKINETQPKNIMTPTSNNNGDEANSRANRTLDEQLSDAFISLLNYKLNQRQQQQQQQLQETDRNSPPADYEQTSAQRKLAPIIATTTTTSSATTINNRTSQQQQQGQQQEIKAQSSGQRTLKKPKDKATATTTTANLQALADSYLGAFQSFGKRRRKRDAGHGANLHGRNVATTAPRHNYVYMEQPQLGATPMAASSKSHHQQAARFTQAIVEMYHTKADEDLSVRLARFRRHADSFDVPIPTNVAISDSNEELIVQSIKIVDRLQFADENEQQKDVNNDASPQSDAGHSPRAARSDLVTADVNNNINKKKQQQQQHRINSWPNQAGRSKQPTTMIDEDDDDDHDSGGSRHGQQLLGSIHRSSSTLSAVSVFLVALCFVFVQISMVLVCLVDWSRWKRTPQARCGTRSSLAALYYPSSTSSSSAGSMINVDCSNTLSNDNILMYNHPWLHNKNHDYC